MLPDFIGPPQLAALALLVQRGVEELHSARNTAALKAAGAYEVGRDYYPVVVAAHLGWIAALAFLIPPTAPVSWPILALYILLQPVRYWIIATLGRLWTHRIIAVDGVPAVRTGPYRLVGHPNYWVTVGETLLLPLAFGAVALAIIMTAIWSAVVAYKAGLEDRALEARPDPTRRAQRSTATK